MNKKAAQFKHYLETRHIDSFLIDDNTHDELHTVVFRSHIDIQGSKLPIIVVLDDSMYGMIRLLVVSHAVHDGNEAAVLKCINTYNKQFKLFKYYLDDDGDLMMDICLPFKEDEADGEMLYAMFNVISNHLTESYQDIKQTIL